MTRKTKFKLSHMKLDIVLFYSAAIVIFVGCASTAKRPLLASEILQFKENKTQLSEVIEYYGEPQSEGISGNLQNICYLSMHNGNKLLFMQFNEKGVLVTKNFEDKKAREECASVLPQAHSAAGPRVYGNSGNQFNSNSSCTIFDGTDQFGRPKYRCPEDSSSATRNHNANFGQNCNIYDGNDNFGRPKYRCP